MLPKWTKCSRPRRGVSRRAVWCGPPVSARRSVSSQPTRCMYVVCMHAALKLPACGMHAARMLHGCMLCTMHVACMLRACCTHVACMLQRHSHAKRRTATHTSDPSDDDDDDGDGGSSGGKEEAVTTKVILFINTTFWSLLGQVLRFRKALHRGCGF